MPTVSRPTSPPTISPSTSCAKARRTCRTGSPGNSATSGTASPLTSGKPGVRSCPARSRCSSAGSDTLTWAGTTSSSSAKSSTRPTIPMAGRSSSSAADTGAFRTSTRSPVFGMKPGFGLGRYFIGKLFCYKLSDMWRTKERNRHLPDPGPQPTAAEVRASLWFSPITVGPIQLAHRTWVPAMVPWRASEDGFVTPEILGWYERFAQGRPGALVVEATGIHDVPSGPLLRIGDDRFVAGLQRLVETVRRASGGQTRLFIQLIDFLAIRRRPSPDKYFTKYLTITDRHRDRSEERRVGKGSGSRWARGR